MRALTDGDLWSGCHPTLPNPTSLDVASHFGCEQWAHFLPEQTTAVSLLDRLIHHSTIVVAAGELSHARRAQERRWPKNS